MTCNYGGYLMLKTKVIHTMFFVTLFSDNVFLFLQIALNSEIMVSIFTTSAIFAVFKLSILFVAKVVNFIEKLPVLMICK